MYKSFLRIGYVLSALALVIAAEFGIALAQDIGHMEREITWNEGPSPLLTMNQRINGEAQKLQEEISKGEVVKRVAFFDIAFPNSPPEFYALDGNGVILVAAISHDSTELPLKRVYVNIGDKHIELDKISYMLSKQDQKSLVAKTFGQFRMDGMYLFPVYLKTQPGKIAADFAKNRDDFGIGDFNGFDLGKFNDLPFTQPSGKGPSPDALKEFVSREFPGFKLP